MARDLVGGIAAVAIGVAYLALALQIRASALDDTVGPAGLPKTLAVIMIGLGLILCVKALLAGRGTRGAGLDPTVTPPETTAADEEVGQSGLGGVVRAAGMLGIGIAYLLIVRTVGYVPAIAALIIAAALYGGTALSWRVFAIGVAGALLYWMVFVAVLGIRLPGGFFADLFPG